MRKSAFSRVLLLFSICFIWGSASSCEEVEVCKQCESEVTVENYLGKLRLKSEKYDGVSRQYCGTSLEVLEANARKVSEKEVKIAFVTQKEVTTTIWRCR